MVWKMLYLMMKFMTIITLLHIKKDSDNLINILNKAKK